MSRCHSSPTQRVGERQTRLNLGLKERIKRERRDYLAHHHHESCQTEHEEDGNNPPSSIYDHIGGELNRKHEKVTCPTPDHRTKLVAGFESDKSLRGIGARYEFIDLGRKQSSVNILVCLYHCR